MNYIMGLNRVVNIEKLYRLTTNLTIILYFSYI